MIIKIIKRLRRIIINIDNNDNYSVSVHVDIYVCLREYVSNLNVSTMEKI